MRLPDAAPGFEQLLSPIEQMVVSGPGCERPLTEVEQAMMVKSLGRTQRPDPPYNRRECFATMVATTANHVTQVMHCINQPKPQNGNKWGKRLG